MSGITPIHLRTPSINIFLAHEILIFPFRAQRIRQSVHRKPHLTIFRRIFTHYALVSRIQNASVTRRFIHFWYLICFFYREKMIFETQCAWPGWKSDTRACHSHPLYAGVSRILANSAKSKMWSKCVPSSQSGWSSRMAIRKRS